MIQYNPPPFPNMVMAVMKVFVWHFTFQIGRHQQKEIQLREYYIHHHQILTKIIVWRGDAFLAPSIINIMPKINNKRDLCSDHPVRGWDCSPIRMKDGTSSTQWQQIRRFWECMVGGLGREWQGHHQSEMLINYIIKFFGFSSLTYFYSSNGINYGRGGAAAAHNGSKSVDYWSVLLGAGEGIDKSISIN